MILLQFRPVFNLVKPSQVNLKGLFPRASYFADFALEELLLLMNAFFMTVPVGFAPKSLAAV